MQRRVYSWFDSYRTIASYGTFSSVAIRVKSRVKFFSSKRQNRRVYIGHVTKTQSLTPARQDFPERRNIYPLGLLFTGSNGMFIEIMTFPNLPLYKRFSVT